MWNGDRFRVYRVNADKDLFLALVEAAQEFWTTYVMPDVEPELDGKASTTEWVSRQIRRTKEIIEADDEFSVYLSERDRIDGSIKNLTELKNAIDNKIKNEIGESGGIESDKFRATWSESAGREKLDVNELIELTGATPEQVDKCTKRGASYRRLTIKRRGNK